MKVTENTGFESFPGKPGAGKSSEEFSPMDWLEAAIDLQGYHREALFALECDSPKFDLDQACYAYAATLFSGYQAKTLNHLKSFTQDLR
jgi:hypothetical protein